MDERMDQRTVVKIPHRMADLMYKSRLEHLETPIEAIGFWSAILLPVLYLVLFVNGIRSWSGLALILGLLILHAIALVVGRNHR